MAHICASLPANEDPLKFVFTKIDPCRNHLSFALHSILEQLDHFHVKMLFIDCSYVFDTIILNKLFLNRLDLGFGKIATAPFDQQDLIS